MSPGLSRAITRLTASRYPAASCTTPTSDQDKPTGPVRSPEAGRPPVRSRRQLIDDRAFRVRTGVPWRDVPVEYGPWGRI
ncbi:transposase [Streptomyces sp. NBC_01527]|uniref:transposase n=1 Tax=unclassified Streptomyces TaxID=2593676 RepID=UPI00325357DD